MTKSTQTASHSKHLRTPKALLIYFILALYCYLMNVPGPVIGYLRQQFQMNYTMASLHFSAFAAGMVLVGFFGSYLLARISHWKLVGVGCLGLGLGGLVLTYGGSPIVTVLGLFVMGLVGTLILSIYPTILHEEMESHSSMGIAEANGLSSVLAALAPLAVGLSAATLASWRPAVLVADLAALALGLWLFFFTKSQSSVPAAQDPMQSKAHLPKKFWGFWMAQILAVSIEFCTIYWSAEYLRKTFALEQALATQFVSLFLLGMVFGRFVGGKLVEKLKLRSVLAGSIAVGILGFALYWLQPQTTLALIGLFLLGLGVAMLYPIILALELEVAGPQKKIAAARSTLAGGLAVLLLPFLLASLADRIGIHSAFGIIAVVYALLIVVLRFTFSIPHQTVQKEKPGTPNSA
ncbi:MAG: MFS transporter [Anaerolineaceae bacterium]|nr:MFS transporter [Anaerolineaceae bacterium]